MQKRIASQPMMGRPRGGGDGRRGRDEWSSAEHNRVPAPPTRIDAERFSLVMARAAGVSQRGKVCITANCIFLLSIAIMSELTSQ